MISYLYTTCSVLYIRRDSNVNFFFVGLTTERIGSRQLAAFAERVNAVIRCCHTSESARHSNTILAHANSRKVQTLPKWEQVLYTYSSFAQGHDMWQQTETRTGT